MIPRAIHFSDSKHPVVRAKLFLAVLWLALSTVLISALLPLGLPLTKTIGSAFSPSTATVALSAKPLRLRLPGNKLVTPRDNDTALHAAPISDNPHALLPFGEQLLSPHHEGESGFARVNIEQPPSRKLPESAYPRGPPESR